MFLSWSMVLVSSKFVQLKSCSVSVYLLMFRVYSFDPYVLASVCELILSHLE